MKQTLQPQTLDSLRAIPLARPPRRQRKNEGVGGFREGSRWQGIQHADLLDAVCEQAERRNVDTLFIQAYTSPSGNTMAAWLEAIHPNKDPYSCLGVVNNNNRKAPLSLYGGLWPRNKACIWMSRSDVGKHTRSFAEELDTHLGQTLDVWIGHIPDYALHVQRLSADTLEPEQAERILLDAGREGLTPFSRLGSIDETYRRDKKNHNSWGLLQAFAEVTKRAPPLKQMELVFRFFKTLEARL